MALETSADLIILDDNKGRIAARRLGLTITGTLGIMIKAKLGGHIQSIRPLLDKLRETDFRISDDLVDVALREAGEE